MDGGAESTILEVARGQGIARLTMNRPRARNALSRALMNALQKALDEIAADPTVKIVILGARGPAFCAGHDLREMRAHPGEAEIRATFAQCSRMMQSIVRLPQPVIARVQGPASAAGCQLVASADLAVAADGASFSTPGVNIGLFCSTPMVALARNVGRKQAMEMLLTGETVDAARARELGLVNRVVPADALDHEVDALAGLILSKSPVSLRIGKEAFYRQLEMPLAEAYEYASAVMTRNMMADDAAEGIDAFLEKRPPCWPGQ
ncbi:MAG: enoyl-CoA hydratase [Alphaproteobacteria bacterium]|nr:enoyl-CoA hydratase [Alphaproteobacteria bacterium]